MSICPSCLSPHHKDAGLGYRECGKCPTVFKVKDDWRPCHPLSAVVRHKWQFGNDPWRNRPCLISPRGTIYLLRGRMAKRAYAE